MSNAGEAAIPIIGIDPPDLPPPNDLDWADPTLARRVGQFRVPRAVLVTDIGLWRQIMSYCLVTRCELLDWEDNLDYIVRSPLLEPIPQNATIPDLMLLLWRNEDGTTTFKGFREPPTQ